MNAAASMTVVGAPNRLVPNVARSSWEVDQRRGCLSSEAVRIRDVQEHVVAVQAKIAEL
jgi:hypothetical protein